MQEAPFRFKQFSVAQDKCAMKITTDGVLLGAWQDVSRAKHILDIGTGTGVIAMMLAQENHDAIIDAIEIDEDAFLQAKENFQNCPWSNRLNCLHTSLQNFTSEKKYDVIVSNPPYFIDDFKTAEHRKNIARHGVALTYEELLSGINRLLSADGQTLLAIPIFNFPLLQSLALTEKLFVVTLTEVIAVTGKQPYLALVQLERKQKIFLKNRIEIQDSKGVFTTEYIALTKDFYLQF